MSDRALKGATSTRDGAVVSLSGGMDSLVLLATALERFDADDIFAVGFHYGQRHSIELQQAKEIAAWYGVSFEIVELPKIFSGGHSYLMGDMDVEPIGSYDELKDRTGGQPSVVPGRNLNFLAMAATYAEVHGVNRVMIANHAGDAGSWHYFDCTPEFIAGAQVAIGVGTGFAISLEAPFTLLPKGKLVQEGARLRVPMHLSQSCYNGVRPACGSCATCHERLEAFRQAGYIDPIEYRYSENSPEQINMFAGSLKEWPDPVNPV